MNLEKNAIGIAGARALADSKQLTQLKSFIVGKETIGEPGQRILLERFGDDVVLFGEDCDSDDDSSDA